MPIQLGVLKSYNNLTYSLNTLLIGIFVLITTITVIIEGVISFKTYTKNNILLHDIRKITINYYNEFKRNDKKIR